MLLFSTKSLFSKSGQEDTRIVGVRHVPATLTHPPLTIFYPATITPTTTITTTAPNHNHNHNSPTHPPPTFKRVGWFHENGVAFFLLGFLHCISKYTRHDTFFFRWVGTPLIHTIALFFPVRWIKFRNVYQDAPLVETLSSTSPPSTDDDDDDTQPPPPRSTKQQQQHPVIIFSHGLTGTGEENSAYHIGWAKRGYIVISIHHTDGSSCCVKACRDESSTAPEKQYYDIPPPYTNYDPTYRPKQVQKRANEIWQVYDYLVGQQQQQKDQAITTTSDSSNSGKEGQPQILPCDISKGMDLTQIITIGYSYGSATVALAALQKPQVVKGIIFLDGWFHIDVQKSAGIEYNFPQEVFDSFATTTNDEKKDNDDIQRGGGDDDEKNHKSSKDDNNVLKGIPSLFLNSEEFQGYPKLIKATTALADNQGSKVHVLEGTGHQNFTDLCFWIPNFVAKRMKPSVGNASPMDVYNDVVTKTSRFIEGLF